MARLAYAAASILAVFLLANAPSVAEGAGAATPAEPAAAFAVETQIQGESLFTPAEPGALDELASPLNMFRNPFDEITAPSIRLCEEGEEQQIGCYDPCACLVIAGIPRCFCP